MTVLLSGLISSLVSLVVTILMNLYFKRYDYRRKLDDTLMQLNNYMLSDPFLENDAALEKYKALNTTDAATLNDKYNIFCIMKYNYLEGYCRFHGFKLKRIKKHIHIKEYLKDNEKWWSENRKINYEAYDERFIHIIEEVVNEA